MRVIVCGGRHYSSIAVVFHALDRIHQERPITMLVHGGATGADDLADKWAKARGVPTTVFEVPKEEWTRLGKKAGPLRNKRMMASGADLVVAIPGWRGTADMVGRAHRAGVEVMAFG